MDVMKQNRINLMRELLSCGTNVPIWHYDGDGHLLDTTAEHLVLDENFFLYRCFRLYASIWKKPYRSFNPGQRYGLAVVCGV